MQENGGTRLHVCIDSLLSVWETSDIRDKTGMT